MQQFRNLTDKIYFKVFLGFIAVSFVMFGVSSFLVGDVNEWVVKIGDKQVSKREFSQLIQRRSSASLREMGDEEAVAYLNSDKFQQDALSSLVNQKRYEILGEHFDFIADYDLILQEIARDANFRNFEGKFDRDSFSNFLLYNGIDESDYIESLSKNISAEIVIKSISASAPIKSSIAIAQEEAYRQLRVVDIINITSKNITNIEAPTDDEVNQFYSKNAEKYVEPERRAITYLEFSKEDLTKNVKISEEELLTYYQDNMDQYVEGQIRDSLHLMFDDYDEADSFLKKYESSLKDDKADPVSKFSTLAKKILQQDEDSIELNNIGRDSIFPELANVIFNLQINQHSSVVKSTIGYHIVLLTNIHKPKQMGFDEVKNDIEIALIDQKREEILQHKLSEIDDNLLLTNSISKTAKRFVLTHKSDPIIIDSLGFNKKNTKEKVVEKFSEFLSRAFSLEEGQISEIIHDIKADKLYVFKVQKIIEERQKELEKIKQQVVSDFLQDKRTKKLQELSQKIEQEVSSNPASFANIAKKYNLKIDKGVELPREYMVTLEDDSKVPYKNKFLLEVFKLNIDQSTPAIMGSKDIYFIAKLNKISQKNIPKKDHAKILNLSKSRFRQEMIDEFNQYLTDKYKVRINKKALSGGL